MARDSDPLVYSTDGAHRRRCPVCGREPCACLPAAPLVPAETVLRLRLEKKGRGGKAVTVVSDLPPRPDDLRALLKDLKTHCGTGGAYKEDRLELQGDQRNKVRAYLERLGFAVRGGG